MISFGALVAGLGQGLEVLDKIKRSLAIGADLNAEARYRRILKALRDAYFFDQGSLSLLKRLAAGESICSSDFDRVSVKWVRTEDDAYRAIQALVDLDARAQVGLSIRDAKMIESIIAMKTGVRADICELFMEMESSYFSGSQEDQREIGKVASRLLPLIEDLNEKIEQIDNTLRNKLTS